MLLLFYLPRPVRLNSVPRPVFLFLLQKLVGENASPLPSSTTNLLRGFSNYNRNYSSPLSCPHGNLNSLVIADEEGSVTLAPPIRLVRFTEDGLFPRLFFLHLTKDPNFLPRTMKSHRVKKKASRSLSAFSRSGSFHAVPLLPNAGGITSSHPSLSRCSPLPARKDRGKTSPLSFLHLSYALFAAPLFFYKLAILPS